MRRLFGAIAGALLLAATAAAGGWWWLDRWTQTPGPSADPVVVEIERGAGLRAISSRLAEGGAVSSARAFAAAALLRGQAQLLKAGEYAFAAGASPAQIIDQLVAGRVLLHPVTVAEGLTAREVMDQLAADSRLSGDLPPMPAEGTLLPDTYLVPRGEPRGTLIRRMTMAMAAELAQVWAGRTLDLPLADAQDALILASLIERETAVPEEYPLVAAVFVNRLRLGMPLQTDPTVIYALAGGKGSLGRPLTRADLTIEHPYNTYRNAGLPPGPIANPGRGALRAAVQPAEVDYLYFVANGEGGHSFARTLAEHNANVAKWRQIRDAEADPGRAADPASVR